MIDSTLGRWLLVGLALVGLVVAVPVVSAHGEESTRGNETVAEQNTLDGDADWAAWMDGHWTAWMDEHVTDHMTPDAVDEMEAHTGATVDEMGQHMASHDHRAYNQSQDYEAYNHSQDYEAYNHSQDYEAYNQSHNHGAYNHSHDYGAHSHGADADRGPHTRGHGC